MSDWKDSCMTHTELFDALDERDKRIEALEGEVARLKAIVEHPQQCSYCDCFHDICKPEDQP